MFFLKNTLALIIILQTSFFPKEYDLYNCEDTTETAYLIIFI